MDHAPRVVVRELDPTESEAVLARNQVGRLAYCDQEGPNIVPLGYVYADGDIYARTSPGSKLQAIQKDARVAFEVDEVESLFEWRSVIARCVLQPLHPVGSDETVERWERAVELLSRLIPETLSPEDPVAHRWFVMRLVVLRRTGRASTLVRPD